MAEILDSALNAFSLKGQHVAVVGASSGIGAAIAIRLSHLGATVSLMARRLPQLEEIRACCASGNHQVLHVDVKDSEALDQAFRKARVAVGSLTGMVYASGICPLRPIQVMDGKHIDEVIDINLKGGLLATRAAVTKGGMSQGGSIVLISSVQAHVAGGAGAAVYAATKAGLEAAQRIFALELAPRKVRINSLAVGAVHTDIWDTENNEMGREMLERLLKRFPLGIGETEDVAHAAAYLLSPAARWITGTTLAVDGGLLCHNRG